MQHITPHLIPGGYTMPMYEVEWTETKHHKARVMVPTDSHALAGAESGELTKWIEQDHNPIVSNGETEITVTALGRVSHDGSVRPL